MPHRTCTIDGCHNEHLARGFCRVHYQRKHANGDFLIRASQTCSVADCDRPVKALSLCSMHYANNLRTGPNRPSCSLQECARPVICMGMCSLHYQRSIRPGGLEGIQRWRHTIAVRPQPVVFGSSVLPDRFWANVAVTPDGCWQWTNSLTHGYGMFRYVSRDGTRRRKGVHVVSYEAFVGPMPDGLVPDHLCHTNAPDCYAGDLCPHRACCHPEHLEPVTRTENGRRGHHLGTDICPAGHPYAGDNLIINSRGYGECRLCRQRQARESYRRINAGKDGGHNRSERKTCPREHPLSHPNLVPAASRRGQRACLACNRAGNQIRKARGQGLHVSETDYQILSDIKFAEIIGAHRGSESRTG